MVMVRVVVFVVTAGVSRGQSHPRCLPPSWHGDGAMPSRRKALETSGFTGDGDAVALPVAAVEVTLALLSSSVVITRCARSACDVCITPGSGHPR